MRKFCMILVSSFLLLAMLMMPAGASGMQAVVWEAASAVPPVNVAGYPRLDILSNGTLILANSGTIRKSVNGGQTWVRKDVTQNSATTVVSSSGQTHTLVRENWQPFCFNGRHGHAFVSRSNRKLYHRRILYVDSGNVQQ